MVDLIINTTAIIAQEKYADTTSIYFFGKGPLAIPVMYAAVADNNNISGVILENVKNILI